MPNHRDLSSPVPWRRSLRAAQQRRLRLALRRRRIFRGRAGVLMAVALSSVAAGGALAQDSTPSASSSSSASATLQKIAQCESGGDPAAVSADGTYRGKYQFDRSTWQQLGGSGDPAAAPESEQDQRALALYRQRGTAPWPNCGQTA